MMTRQLELFSAEPEPLHSREIGRAGYMRFESVDPYENRYRFYIILWQKTLWGEWTIQTTWGRIGTVGRSQLTFYDSEADLARCLPDLIARRLAHNYIARPTPWERASERAQVAAYWG